LGRREEGTLRFNARRTTYRSFFFWWQGRSPFSSRRIGGRARLYRAYFVEPVAIFYVAVDLLRRPSEVRGVLLGLGLAARCSPL